MCEIELKIYLKIRKYGETQQRNQLQRQQNAALASDVN